MATNDYNENACLVNNPLEVAIAPNNGAPIWLAAAIILVTDGAANCDLDTCAGAGTPYGDVAVREPDRRRSWPTECSADTYAPPTQVEARTGVTLVERRD